MPHLDRPLGPSRFGDERGVVFVEKLIAYLPLLLVFFAAWELAELSAAKLVVQRASAAAGRAAIVVLPDDPVFYEDEPVGSFDGRRREDIELAAAMVLSAIPRLRADFEVDVSEVPDGFGPLEVTVTASYDCGLVSLVCGADDAIELTATSTHTYHGAKYAYASAGLGAATGALMASGEDYRSGYRVSGRASGGGNGAGGGGGGTQNTAPRMLGSGCAEIGKQRVTTFYRTMDPAHVDVLKRTGKMPGTRETCISPTLAFSMNYDGVLVKFTVKETMMGDLVKDGFKHTSAWLMMKCPCMKEMRRGWNQDGAAFKTEGAQLNICLGVGKGLDTFNDSIVSFEIIDKNSQKALDTVKNEEAELEMEAKRQKAELNAWRQKKKTLREECNNHNMSACSELSTLMCQEVEPEC